MTEKRKRLFIVFLLAIVLVACVVLLLVETQAKVMRRYFDDVIYDNWNHYLPCEQLPSISDAERILREHQEEILQIEQVNPGFVGVEIDYPCPNHADLIFWYATHQDRIKIEEIIGDENFFGIPYRLHNR
jgi:hypothetical protein